MPVEAERGHRVDGVAAALFLDPVVPAGDVEVSVVEQLGQHVDGNPGVGVALGVGVPVGIGHDLGLVELDAVAVPQDRELVDPGPVPEIQQSAADRFAAGGVGVGCGQPDQLRERGGGETLTDPPLLGGDQCGGGLVDRQPALAPVTLVVVIDQHGSAVGVAGQAVPAQPPDLLGAPTGVDEQLDRDPDLTAGRSAFEPRQLLAQLRHDRRGQIPAGFTAFGFGGDVAEGEGEIVAQPRGGAAGRVSPSARIRPSIPLDVPADPGPQLRAALADRGQVGLPVQERLDVAARQDDGMVAVVGSAALQAA